MLIWTEIPLTGLYVMRAAFLIGVTLVELFMFIGFSLMYLSADRADRSAPEGQAVVIPST
jgi:hypothetical protein